MLSPCDYYNKGLCHSCNQIAVPYSQQLTRKQQQCEQQLNSIGSEKWLPIFQSAPLACRNKAKMVVSGTKAEPILGIINEQGHGVDLAQCLLYLPQMQQLFPAIRQFIVQSQLEPYDVQQRKGELKFVLMTYSESQNQFLIRFVLRSKEGLDRIRKHLNAWLEQYPQIVMVSVNIQPKPAAIIEGLEEIVLTANSQLQMVLNDMPLYLRPQSFFQTNDQVAAALYIQAQQWLKDIQPKHLWDLFCGVGGFALHAAQVMTGKIEGIEISAQAIESAKLSVQKLELKNCEFRALSADEFALEPNIQQPDCVIVNPPRRGIGAPLASFLNQAQEIQWLIYSSCHPQSLAKDLETLDDFETLQARVFDMFPHTDHAEVIVLLRRITQKPQ